MSMFEVRRGNPTPEELAVALSVLQSAVTAKSTPMRRTVRHWAAPQLRAPEHRFGPRQWVLAQRVR